MGHKVAMGYRGSESRTRVIVPLRRTRLTPSDGKAGSKLSKWRDAELLDLLSRREMYTFLYPLDAWHPDPPSVVDSPSVPYLAPQLGTGHPCTRTSSVLYFLIRYLDPKVGNERGLGAKAVISRLTRSKDIIQVIDVAL
jgi:hypothetical protein